MAVPFVGCATKPKGRFNVMVRGRVMVLKLDIVPILPRKLEFCAPRLC